MSAHDASVSVLMDRMSDIDKQRRVLSMRQKELEAKLAFATSEKADLEREATAMDDEESRLKAELEALTVDEQRLELQTMEVGDHLRRTEEEERVHTAAATTELQTLAAEKAEWLAKTEELEALRRTWENDPATSKCLQSLRDAMAGVAALQTKVKALEHKKAEVEAESAALRARQQSLLTKPNEAISPSSVSMASLPLPAGTLHGSTKDGVADTEAGEAGAPSAGTAAPFSASSGEPSVQSVAEEMQKAAYEWGQVKARHAWAVTSAQREVDGLRTRAAELQELLENMWAARQEVAQRWTQLQRCLESGCCVRCTPQKEC